MKIIALHHNKLGSKMDSVFFGNRPDSGKHPFIADHVEAGFQVKYVFVLAWTLNFITCGASPTENGIF